MQPSDAGAIYRLSPEEAFAILHRFQMAESAFPDAGLIQARDGNFYGTTIGGGPSRHGTVYKLTPGGRLSILHAMGGRDSNAPRAALLQGADGNFYGTIFRLTPEGVFTKL